MATSLTFIELSQPFSNIYVTQVVFVFIKILAFSHSFLTDIPVHAAGMWAKQKRCMCECVCTLLYSVCMPVCQLVTHLYKRTCTYVRTQTHRHTHEKPCAKDRTTSLTRCVHGLRATLTCTDDSQQYNC